MAEEKTHFSPDTVEFNHDADSTRNTPRRSLTESIRIGLTVLSLLMATSIVGMSGNALAVYNKTHVGEEYSLPLWPFNFNLGPTIALVAGAAAVLLANAISLITSTVPAVSLSFCILQSNSA
jgi:hypothetical protein